MFSSLAMLHIHYTRGQTCSKAFWTMQQNPVGCVSLSWSLLNVFAIWFETNYLKISWFLGNSRRQRWFKITLVGKLSLPKPNRIQEKPHFIYTYKREITLKRTSEKPWNSPRLTEHFSFTFPTEWIDCTHLLSITKQYELNVYGYHHTNLSTVEFSMANC